MQRWKAPDASHCEAFPFVPQVHVDQELLIYEAFPYDQQQAQNLKVRFKKVRAPQSVAVSDHSRRWRPNG